MAKGLAYLAALACLLGRGQASPVQVPLQTATVTDNSNFILASLHSLLKSWDNAYAPNGHAVMPATVKPGTLLYHMGNWPAPTGLDWFAFDAEHSYQFGGGQGGGMNR